MKTFKTASIIAFTYGGLFMLYNLYLMISTDLIFVENDIPSTSIGLIGACATIYIFIMFRKLLNMKYKNMS